MEVKQTAWFDSRFYRINIVDGEKRHDLYYWSVTTKLGAKSKPYLAQWRGMVGNREADFISQQGMDKGSREHYGWYLMTTGGAVLYNPLERPNYDREQIAEIEKESNGILILSNQREMFDLYKLKCWHQEVQPKVEASEMIVYSHTHQEAGQLDKLVFIKEGEYMINGAKPLYIPEGRYVIDLKTGKAKDEDSNKQIACYAKCYEEMTKEKVKGGITIWVGARTKKGIEGLNTDLIIDDELEDNYRRYRAISDVWMNEFSGTLPKIFEFPTIITLKA